MGSAFVDIRGNYSQIPENYQKYFTKDKHNKTFDWPRLQTDLDSGKLLLKLTGKGSEQTIKIEQVDWFGRILAKIHLILDRYFGLSFGEDYNLNHVAKVLTKLKNSNDKIRHFVANTSAIIDRKLHKYSKTQKVTNTVLYYLGFETQDNGMISKEDFETLIRNVIQCKNSEQLQYFVKLAIELKYKNILENLFIEALESAIQFKDKQQLQNIAAAATNNAIVKDVEVILATIDPSKNLSSEAIVDQLLNIFAISESLFYTFYCAYPHAIPELASKLAQFSDGPQKFIKIIEKDSDYAEVIIIDLFSGGHENTDAHIKAAETILSKLFLEYPHHKFVQKQIKSMYENNRNSVANIITFVLLENPDHTSARKHLRKYIQDHLFFSEEVMAPLLLKHPEHAEIHRCFGELSADTAKRTLDKILLKNPDHLFAKKNIQEFLQKHLSHLIPTIVNLFYQHPGHHFVQALLKKVSTRQDMDIIIDYIEREMNRSQRFDYIDCTKEHHEKIQKHLKQLKKTNF